MYIIFLIWEESLCCSGVSGSLRPHGLQHTRIPCPSPSPQVCSNSCPLNQWCHPIISSSVVPFSSYLQSFPASGSFPVSQFFASGGESFASVLPMNTQDRSPLGWTGWISLQPKGLSRVFFSTTVQRHQFFSPQPFLLSSSHIPTWLLKKQTFVGNVISLLFNTLSKFVIDFLPRVCLKCSYVTSLSLISLYNWLYFLLLNLGKIKLMIFIKK